MGPQKLIDHDRQSVQLDNLDASHAQSPSSSTFIDGLGPDEENLEGLTERGGR